ncbi:hypothetical protein FQR65_LT11051 [Abscondita terminalis]|nr:hypothetical protein FQR65_LT11051 [Abscondita terminalis]
MIKPGTPMYDKILSGESNVGPLKPIGDVCSCGRTIVTPAHVPKPACSGCGGSGSGSTSILEQAATSTLEQALEGTSGTSSDAQSSFTSQQLGGIVVDVPVCGLPVIQPSRPVYYGSQVPADAVSKALAYQQLQSKQYALDHELQYGFKTMPKESIRYSQHQKPYFHEDNIYRLNGDVLELGKILNAPSVDEVAIAELEEEEEPEVEIEPVKVQEITLGSLGFVPTYGPKTRFTNVEVPQPHITEYQTSSCGVDAVPTCNDGFRGGQVIIKEEPIRSDVLPQKTVVGYVSEEGGPQYISDAVYSYSANPRAVVSWRLFVPMLTTFTDASSTYKRRTKKSEHSFPPIMNVCVVILLVFIIGAYCNCGCLNCNKQFRVLSPPGARVKVIHKSVPCSCPTSLPYSVEVPVTPNTRVSFGRSYGYKVQAERRREEEAPDPCPTLREYDIQMQIPREAPQTSKYLVGLVASPDRIVFESPSRPLPRACLQPNIESLVVPQRIQIQDVNYRYGPNVRKQRIIWKPQRSKRSINYKLLASNTDDLHMNRRKSMNRKMRVFSDRRGPLSGVLGSKRNSLTKRRFRRSVRDDFFDSEEEGSNEIEKTFKKRRSKVKNSDPIGIMQSMPFLKMLSLPLKYMTNIQENPIVAAIPKVLRVSQRYFMEFAQNFVDDYKRLKKKKNVHKKIFKRNCDCRKKRDVFSNSVINRTKRDVDNMSWKELLEELHQIATTHKDESNKDLIEEFLSIIKEIKNHNQPRSKRDASFLHDILKLIKAEKIAARKRRSIPKLAMNTLEQEILRTVEKLRELIQQNISEDLHIFEHLLKLQNLMKSKNLVEKIEESEQLKEKVLQEIILKIEKNDNESVGSWIKTMILLQKFHCALQSLKKDGNHRRTLDVISSISFLKSSTRRDLFKELKQQQGAITQGEIQYLNGLKLLLASNDESRIRESSTLIWQTNNLRKLQRESIVELKDKLDKKQRVRQELKILFDLQKQLEEYREKQRRLLDEVSE